MKELLVLLPLFLIISVIPISFADNNEIPSWVKIIAGAWYNDEIDDNTFSEAISFLIENNIIKIENPLNMSLAETPVQVLNMQKIIDESNAYQLDLENQIHVLEEENQDMMNAENREWYDQELVNLRSELTKHYEDRINIIINDTDAETEERKNEYTELSEKKEKIWNEYQRLYNSISEVRENTNPSDFE